MKRRKMAAAVAAVLAANALLSMPFTTSALDTIKVEFEDGTTENDCYIESDLAGYSGTGYVYLKDNSATIPAVSVEVELAEAGSFGLTIGYAAPYGTKGATLEINGQTVDANLMFEESEGFTEFNYGKVPLNAGKNTITIRSTWGYTIFDYLTIGEYVPPSRPEIYATQTNTCDADAIDSAKQLMAYLSSIYGEHILSGQQEVYQYGPHDMEYEFEYIKDKTGDYPAIRGFDYGNFCNELFGGDDGSTDRVIEWAKRGGIATASFHLNVPTDFASYEIGNKLDWDKTTYTQYTDFSPSAAATEGTKENTYYTRALDKLAAEFHKLEDAGIPLIWRPLHEAEGGGGEGGSWFWWGREGSAAYRELYRYTYDYLTNVKECHNLIWEWNSYNFSTSANWYPGDEYVDIIGYDKYNCTDWSTGQAQLVHNDSAIPDVFYGIMEKYNNAKMISMAENDCFSTVDNLVSEKAGWLYFLTWYDGGSDDTNFLTNPMFNTEKDLIDMYTSDYCITLSELPDFGTIEIDPDATNPVENTEPTVPEEGHASITYDKETGNFKIDLPEPADVIYLVAECDDDVDYANGGLGVSIEIDGKYYWANVQWETTKSGEIKLDLAEKLLNVSLNVDGENVIIEDEEIIAAVKAALGKQKSFEGQIWYVEVDKEQAENSKIKIVDAYIKKAAEGTTDPVEETTEAPENPTDHDVESLGDVNVDGKVSLADVVLLNKHLMVGEEVSEEGLRNADVDLSGEPDEVDALNILKYIIKLVKFPVK